MQAFYKCAIFVTVSTCQISVYSYVTLRELPLEVYEYLWKTMNNTELQPYLDKKGLLGYQTSSYDTSIKAVVYT